mgnify:CR=1 FL=1
MRISLSEEQDSRLLEWISRMTAAEVSSDVEPSDYMIQILVSPIFGASAVAKKGSAIFDLGDVDLELSDMWKLAAPSSMDC